MLNEAKLAAIDTELATLPAPAPDAGRDAVRPNADWLVSDLLANARTRAIIERLAPGLAGSRFEGLYPQTSLRNLQPLASDILPGDTLARIEAELQALP